MPDFRNLLLGAALWVGPVVCAAAPGVSAPNGALVKPPEAPIKPVVETLWGRKVTDNYRYMEELNPATVAWMKAQGAYTRSVLDKIKPLAQLKTEVAQFSASFGLVKGYARFGGRGFYQQRAPGSDDFDLIASDDSGTRKIVDMAALRAANGGKPFAINYFLASPDGAKVAVGISAGGSGTRRLPYTMPRAEQSLRAPSIVRNSVPRHGVPIRASCISFACRSSGPPIRRTRSI
jgi:protease II